MAKRLEAGEFKTVSDAERVAGTRGRKMTAADEDYCKRNYPEEMANG